MGAGIAARFAGTALGKALAPQLAKWGPKLKAATPNILPFMPNPAQPTWRNAAIGLAIDAVPETGYAALLASQLPEGTPWHERAGAFAQDAALGTAIGTLGTAGIGAGMRRAGLPERTAHLTQMGVSPFLYMGANAVVPRPFEEKAWKRAENKQIEEERQRRQLEDQQLAEAVRSQTEQGLLTDLFGGWQ